ncbi:MAG: 2Fe-2S iron-sulfur cluster-binding protein [Nitrospinota bacterium]
MAEHSVELETPEGKVRLKVREDEYLLDAGRKAGCGLPATCQQGWCITCAGVLLQGKVDHSDAVRFFPQDEEAGFVLLCSAKPRSDLRIRTHQSEPMKRHRLAHRLPAPRG